MAGLEVNKVESGPRHATYHVTAYGRLVGVIYETSYTGREMYGVFRKTGAGLTPLKPSENSMDAALAALREVVGRRRLRKWEKKWEKKREENK